jgi:WD40 repeat protein
MRLLWLAAFLFPLITYAQNREIVLPVSPSGEIRHIAVSPDSQLMITGDEQDVFVYELATRRLLLSLQGVWPKDIVIAPNNRSFTICHHEQADVYSLDSLKLVYQFTGIGYEMNKAAYSHNGRLLALTGVDNKALVFNLQHGEQLGTFEDKYYITNPVFSRNDSLLKIATNNNRVVAWNIYSGAKAIDTCLCDYASLYEQLNSLGLTPLYFPGNGDTTYLMMQNKVVIESGLSEESIRLSADGKYLQAVSWNRKPDVQRYIADSSYSYEHDSRLLMWDYKTGKKISGIALPLRTPGFSVISDSLIAYPSSRDIIVSTFKGEQRQPLFAAQMDVIRAANLTYTKKLLVAETMNNQLKIWNVFTGKLIRTIDGFSETINYAADSTGTTLVFNERFKNRLYIADLTTQNPPTYIENDASESDIYGAAISADAKRMAVGTRSGIINVFDEKRNKLFTAVKTDDCCTIEYIHISNDNRYLMASHKVPEVWDINSRQKLPADPASLFSSMLIDKYAPPAVYNAMAGVVISYNLIFQGKETEVKWYSFADGNYLIALPDGYYMSTPGAAKRLHYRQGRQLLSFDQLDVKYNRPDKVLAVLMSASGTPDLHLIQSYGNAYQKRIRRLGIDTSLFAAGFSVPQAGFDNRQQISFQQTGKKLSLHITGEDSLYRLDRFNIWVNESPLYGTRGIDLRPRGLHKIDTTITITLSDGDNRIETSVSNINGTESYRMPLLVHHKPAIKSRSRLYFIGIGIDHFRDSRQNLRWSVKDVRDLAASLRKRYGNDCIIDTLFDQQVSVSNVMALKQKLKKAGVDDKVIVAYSGHGLLSSDYDYYLSTYDVNFQSPEKNGLPYSVFENLLDSIMPRQKLMLIDACHSGELDKEEKIKIDAAGGMLAKNGVNAKGIITESTDTTARIGLQNSFELMQALFANISRGTGATIISAAAGTQFAQERTTLRNGVFTFSILEYMRNKPHVTVSELKQQVNKRVQELTEGLQVPTARTETMTTDWQVW